MIFNWIHSFINCFDQSLENINGLFMFSNKQEKHIWVFQLWQSWFQDLKIHIKLWFFQREWNRIAIVLISVCTVNNCNPFSIYCISGVVLPRSVVCSWGGQDQYSWCVLPKVNSWFDCLGQEEEEKQNTKRKYKKKCNRRISHEVTHPSTTLAQARLTAEF